MTHKQKPSWSHPFVFDLLASHYSVTQLRFQTSILPIKFFPPLWHGECLHESSKTELR